jgi:hypothetical protein
MNGKKNPESLFGVEKGALDPDGVRYKILRVPVKEGSLGETFRLLRGYKGATGRVVDEVHVRSMHPWDESIEDQVLLIQTAKGFFYIADGQHRMTYLSRQEGTQFIQAKVYHEEDIPGDLPEWIRRLNSGGRPWSIHDALRNVSTTSQWPGVQRAHFRDLALGYSRGQIWKWANVVKAYLRAKHAQENGEIPARTKFRTKTGKRLTPREKSKVIDFWMTSTKRDAECALQALRWWKPIAEEAKERKIKGFLTAEVMTFAFLLWQENQHRKNFKTVKNRLLNHGEAKEVSKYANETDQLALRSWFLRAANYKIKQDNRLTLLGKTE